MKNHRIKQQAVKAIEQSIPRSAIFPHNVKPKPMAIQSAKGLLKPGNAIETLFKLAGIKNNGKCGCANMKHQMNRFGWKWCWKNRKLILDHLASQAKKRGIIVKPKIASMISYLPILLLRRII